MVTGCQASLSISSSNCTKRINVIPSSVTKKASKRLAILSAAFLLASCNGVLDSSVPKHERPVPDELVKKMEIKGMSLGAPILLRIYKQENVLEVWKKDNTQRYAFLTGYEICKWSGELGPKLKEGDKQAPEGFYHVTPALMNPNSKYHLSFNMGFPNAFDRANDRTGSYLMIHGACSSAGCYSMTDEYAEEIYALAREAFRGGQKAFQIQAYPFRMTAENLAKNVNHPDFRFWTMLKEGADHFEVSRLQPKVDVCEKRYVFNRTVEEGETFSSRRECPLAKIPQSLALAFNEKQKKDQDVFSKILKRNANSPFVKEEDKPLTLTASIKASATVGPVTTYDPVAIARAQAARELAEKEAAERAQAQRVATTQPRTQPVTRQASPVRQQAPAVAATPQRRPVVARASEPSVVTQTAAEVKPFTPKPEGESINPISAEIADRISQAHSTSSATIVPQPASRSAPDS